VLQETFSFLSLKPWIISKETMLIGSLCGNRLTNLAYNSLKMMMKW